MKQLIRHAMSIVTLPGRIQVVPGKINQIFDVSRNPASVAMLANYLNRNPVLGKTYAAFSMLADKDIVSTIQVIQWYIDEWHVAPIISERAASLDLLRCCFKKIDIQKLIEHEFIKMAYAQVNARAFVGDRILVFGSFRVVAEAQEQS